MMPFSRFPRTGGRVQIGLNKVAKIVVEELKSTRMEIEFTDKKGFAGKGKEDGFRVVDMAPDAARTEVQKVWIAVGLQLMRLMKKECPEVPLDETEWDCETTVCVSC